MMHRPHHAGFNSIIVMRLLFPSIGTGRTGQDRTGQWDRKEVTLTSLSLVGFQVRHRKGIRDVCAQATSVNLLYTKQQRVVSHKSLIQANLVY